MSDYVSRVGVQTVQQEPASKADISQVGVQATVVSVAPIAHVSQVGIQILVPNNLPATAAAAIVVLAEDGSTGTDYVFVWNLPYSGTPPITPTATWVVPVSPTAYEPLNVTLDPSGNIYLLDSSNSLLVLMTPSGVFSTFASFSSFYGANLADSVCCDKSGNVYFLAQNSAGTASDLVKYTPAAVMSVVTSLVYSSVGLPNIVKSDGTNLWVTTAPADFSTSNCGILKITPSGGMTTFATVTLTGSDGYTGSGLDFDSSGNVYLTISTAVVAGQPTYIQKFGPTGTSVGVIYTSESAFEGYAGSALDPATGDFFIAGLLTTTGFQVKLIVSGSGSIFSNALQVSTAHPYGCSPNDVAGPAPTWTIISAAWQPAPYII